MNKIVKVKQCTIIWHVDDLIFLMFVPTLSLLLLLELAQSMEILKIAIAQGKIHKYIRMTINYFSPGKEKLSMVD